MFRRVCSFFFSVKLSDIIRDECISLVHYFYDSLTVAKKNLACFIFLKIQKLFCITFDFVDFTGIVCFKTKLGETERNRRPGLK